MLFLPIHVHGERQVFAGLKEMQFFLQQQRVGAEINVLLPRHQPFDDLVDFRVHQRLTAGDRNHRRAALFHGLEAFFRAQFRF